MTKIAIVIHGRFTSSISERRMYSVLQTRRWDDVARDFEAQCVGDFVSYHVAANG
jgi:hypothetical protein